MAVAFGGSLWIVNPTRRMGIRLRFGIVLPLVPGFPLVYRMGSHTGSTRCGMMDLDDSVGVPTMLGEV